MSLDKQKQLKESLLGETIVKRDYHNHIVNRIKIKKVKFLTSPKTGRTIVAVNNGNIWINLTKEYTIE